VTGEEVAARIAERKMGHPGPLSRACFDARCDECGLWGCQCRCHYLSAEQVRRFIVADALEAKKRMRELRVHWAEEDLHP
jgi:hypothetical protein